MKDESKLFEGVSEEVYELWYNHLLKMRVAYPTYRDDQLLMYAICCMNPFSINQEQFLDKYFKKEGR